MPIQKPHVPILVAGGGEKTTLRLVAKYADASNMGAASWAGGAFSPDDARRKFDVLRAHCDEIGRPFDSIVRTAQINFSLADSREAAQAMRAEVEAHPTARRALAFSEGIHNFSTPDEAIEKLTVLKNVGFEYFVGGYGNTTEAIERFARDVMRPVRESSVTA